MSAQQALIVILMLPRKSLELIAFALAVHDHLEGNAKFPNPTVPLPLFKALIEALVAAEAKAETKAKGAAKQRDAAEQKVRRALWRYRDYVQSVVETQLTFADAAAMAESAFMTFRKATKRGKAAVSAKNTGVSGTVEVDAKKVARQAMYYWQFSQDQVNWSNVPESFLAKRVISGLTPLQTYYFRFRAITRTGAVDYSQIVSLVVL